MRLMTTDAFQAKAPISQDEFERFLTRLLSTVNTYIGPRQPNGERRVVFHVPFVLDYPDLVKWLGVYSELGGDLAQLTVSTDASSNSPGMLLNQFRECVRAGP